MPDIDLRVMKRDLAEQSVPVESAKLTLRAVRADGPFTSVSGSDVTTSPTLTVTFRDGAATDRIFLPPTDGTYGWEFELLVDGALLLSEVRGIPTSEAVVSYGSLPKLDRSTLQPSDDVVAAWESTAAGALDARDASVAAARRAEGHARDAASSAGAAAGSAGSAASSAGEAAGSAGSAAESAGEAAGSAGAAAGSAGEASDAAGRASDSAAAAAESERKAGLSAKAAGTSESNAATSERNAATSASETVESARAASGFATDAGKAKTDAEKLKGDVEKVVQTATFLFVQQGDQPAGVLNLADVKTNAFIHRRLTGNVTGITLPTAPTPGQMITLVLTQDATGGRTLTTPAPIFGHEGLDPVLSTTAGAVDMIGMVYDGVRWWSVAPAQRGS